MKKVLALTLALAMLIVGITLAGCGPKNGGTTQTPASAPPSAPASTPAPSGTTAPQAAKDGSAWPDIPIYSSLRQIQKSSMPVPPTAGNAKAEFRYYETKDSLEKVVAFYKSQMPAKGWEETPWTEAPQLSMGMYTKNAESNIAWVWVFSVEGKTQVLLGRATKE